MRRYILLILLFASLLQLNNFLGVVHISGESMNNTLQDGSFHIYVNSKYQEIDQFDIVICQLDTMQSPIIKRVVGRPGDELVISDGQMYVNSKRVDQDFDYIPDDTSVDVKLGIDQYYVLGDNRPNSVDSRELGVINKEQIKGIVII